MKASILNLIVKAGRDAVRRTVDQTLSGELGSKLGAEVARQVKHRAQAARDQVREAYREAKSYLRQSRTREKVRTLSTFVRPELGSVKEPWRRVLEPIVAASAAGALLALASIGFGAFVIFLISGALVYGILTFVFGIRLDVRMPSTAW